MQNNVHDIIELYHCKMYVSLVAADKNRIHFNHSDQLIILQSEYVKLLVSKALKLLNAAKS